MEAFAALSDPRGRECARQLDALRIDGATITIDAMGCQHALVDKIVEKKADYIVAGLLVLY